MVKELWAQANWSLWVKDLGGVEEEVKARVAGGEKSGRVVLCVTHLGSIGNANSVIEVV